MSDAKERIIEATIQVISREGLAGTTTRKIADEARINLAMLHYYFGDKNELLVAVHEALIQRVRDILLAQPAIQPGDDVRLIVERDLTAFWNYIEEVPETQIAQHELTLYALREPQSAVRAKQLVASYSALVEERCRQLSEITQQTCSITFAELARFIISGIDGLTLQFLSDRDSVRAARDLHLFISAMLTLAYGFQPSHL